MSWLFESGRKFNKKLVETSPAPKSAQPPASTKGAAKAEEMKSKQNNGGI